MPIKKLKIQKYSHLPCGEESCSNEFCFCGFLCKAQLIMGDFIGLLHRFWVFGESEDKEINKIFNLQNGETGLER